MAVTTRTENVEQEAPSRPPQWIGWTVVWAAVAALIGAGAVVWTASNQELMETTSPATVTLSSDLERYTVMSDDVLRQHLVDRGLIPSAAVPTELERFQQMEDGELRQHLVDRGLIPSAAVLTELERYQQMSDDELRQHLVDRGLIPSAAMPAP